ncbi:MAG: 50S ribosome-binding GTPase, partial [Lachnospiraceae bacterium]|nr:50S ribosome-binding GTPase [Lachnospiraceae bacterium]
MTTLNDTPSASRLHIGFFGARNSGKSTLVNALSGQQVTIVSDVPGTTTDPVYKAMELHGIGPAELIDTAGYDDGGELGRLRVEKTRLAAEKTDIAVLLFSGREEDEAMLRFFKGRKTPVVPVISATAESPDGLAASVRELTGTEPIAAKTPEAAAAALRRELVRLLPEGFSQPSITGALVSPGD